MKSFEHPNLAVLLCAEPWTYRASLRVVVDDISYFYSVSCEISTAVDAGEQTLPRCPCSFILSHPDS